MFGRSQQGRSTSGTLERYHFLDELIGEGMDPQAVQKVRYAVFGESQRAWA